MHFYLLIIFSVMQNLLGYDVIVWRHDNTRGVNGLGRSP